MTNIERTDNRIIDRATVASVLRQIARFDIPATDQVKPRPRPRRRPKPLPLPELSPGSRRVHLDGSVEREPLDGEPYMIVERVGDFETTLMPYNFDGGRKMYVPRFGGPWEITELSDDGKWIVWIRLAKGVWLARKAVSHD